MLKLFYRYFSLQPWFLSYEGYKSIIFLQEKCLFFRILRICMYGLEKSHNKNIYKAKVSITTLEQFSLFSNRQTSSNIKKIWTVVALKFSLDRLENHFSGRLNRFWRKTFFLDSGKEKDLRNRP